MEEERYSVASACQRSQIATCRCDILFNHDTSLQLALVCPEGQAHPQLGNAGKDGRARSENKPKYSHGYCYVSSLLLRIILAMHPTNQKQFNPETQQKPTTQQPKVRELAPVWLNICQGQWLSHLPQLGRPPISGIEAPGSGRGVEGSDDCTATPPPPPAPQIFTSGKQRSSLLAAAVVPNNKKSCNRPATAIFNVEAPGDFSLWHPVVDALNSNLRRYMNSA